MNISYTPNFTHFYLFYYERLKKVGFLLKFFGILLILSSLSFAGLAQLLNILFIVVLTTPRLLAYVLSLVAFQRYKKGIKAIQYTFDDNGIAFRDEKKISSGKTKWEFFTSYTVTKRYLAVHGTKAFLPVIFLVRANVSGEHWEKVMQLVKEHLPNKKRSPIIAVVLTILVHLIFYVLYAILLGQFALSFLGIYRFECVGLQYCTVVTKPRNSEWQEYTNKTYGYSFTYPPDMYVDTSFYNPSKEEKHVRLLFFNPTKKTIPVKNGFGNMEYQNEITVRYLGENLSDKEIEAYDRHYKNFYAKDTESVTQPDFVRGKILYRYEKRDKINDFYYLNSIFAVHNRYFEISLRAPHATPELNGIYEKILDSVTPR